MASEIRVMPSSSAKFAEHFQNIVEARKEKSSLLKKYHRPVLNDGEAKGGEL